MSPEHRPVATGFFPAARVGLFVGVLVAAVGANVLKQAPAAPAADVLDVAPRVPVAGALAGPVVAHVWLENCADCMSAFQAHARLQEQGALAGIPQVNVAYGRSTPAFRAKYRVDQNLIEDEDGSQVVNAYGIGSFTTLVIDAKGELLLKDRPDRDGYLDRVREAWSRAR